METTIMLDRSMFHSTRAMNLAQCEHAGTTITAQAQSFSNGIEYLTLSNGLSNVTVLPYLGGMVWDYTVGGRSLTMHSQFNWPLPAQDITDTYGCFAFHSGVLASGVPGPQDTHPLHGELSVAPMDNAMLVMEAEGVTVASQRTLRQGFGYHYEVVVTTLFTWDGQLQIGLTVENISKAVTMPVQYMCHINPLLEQGMRLNYSFDEHNFELRKSIPAHVHPTPEWSKVFSEFANGERTIGALDDPTMFDPELVWVAKNLGQHGDRATATMLYPDGPTVELAWDTEAFPYAIRWLMYNEDMQVAAAAIPSTSRPEGFTQASQEGVITWLEPGESKSFNVEIAVR